jgi:hypothetical protein
MLAVMRQDAMRSQAKFEPVACRQCGRVLNRFDCPCGWVSKEKKRSRVVVQHDGTLIEQEGDLYRPKRVSQSKNVAQLWEQCYWRCKKSGRTFRQAVALFQYENRGCRPPEGLPYMPWEPRDWFRKVAAVEYERLIPKPGKVGKA